jgi:CubicO group peptidase (beta-lactamase class C family)
MKLEALRGWLDERGRTGEFSGVAMAWKDGQPTFAHAVGLASRRFRVPNELTTRFHVGSITKLVTASAALRLVEGGRLSLQTRVIDLLGPDERPSSITGALTLHHLLSHTSGLANYHDDEDDTHASFASSWVRLPPQSARGPRDLLPLLTNLAPVFAPGEGFRYADANYIMVGIIIETVTGQSFASAATDLVLLPAGMTDSSFTALDEDPEALATGYLTNTGPAESRLTNIYSIPAGGQPDGGLITTAIDLGRLVDAWNDGRLLTGQSRAQAMQEYGRINDDVESYGYGLEMLMIDGQVRILGHAGGDPGVSAMLSHYIDEQVTTIVLCNQDRGSWAAAKQLASAFGIDDPRV